MSRPSSCTYTHLFTDIQGSTRLWEERPEAMHEALAHHFALLRQVVAAYGGWVTKTTGDGLCAVFENPGEAVTAALGIQRRLREPGPGGLELKVRIAVHTGETTRLDEDYYGSTTNRVARIMATGHGGQILLSAATRALVTDRLPDGAALLDLGTHRLRDLQEPERLFQLLHPDLPLEFPPLRSLDAAPNNLPQQPTSFVGREQDLLEARRLLAGTRLLTLIGSGGMGKTRLSLAVGAEVLPEFADGVWLVELAPLTDPALAPHQVTSALSVPDTGAPAERALELHLRGKHMLLILDNCEHLVEAAATLVTRLLATCPRVTILCTSRESLNVAGETTYRLRSLSHPPPSSGLTAEAARRFEAVRLFEQRAQAVMPAFRLDDENAVTVAEICRRLDGIPLALELAAARVRALSPAALLERLNDRFHLLTGGSRTALPRQRTLRALIDWSYDLLSPQERLLLHRLSVFAGGWSYESCEAVCSDGEPEDAARSSGARTPEAVIESWEILELLTSLLDKSLVMFEPREGTDRYRLLETVRDYARGRLRASGEEAALRERHRDHFLRLAEMAAPELQGPDQRTWLDLLDAEHENLRAALDECRESPTGGAAGVRLCAALWRFWHARGHATEGRSRCGIALAHPEALEPTPARAVALSGAAALARQQSDFLRAQELYREGLAAARASRNRVSEAACLNGLAICAHVRGDFQEARARYEDALALNRSLQNRAGEAGNLNNMGITALAENDLPRARELYLAALLLHRELGNRRGAAGDLHNLGKVAHAEGRYAAAQEHFMEALQLHRELRDPAGEAGSLTGLGLLAHAQGDLQAALRHYERALALHRSLGGRAGEAATLSALGRVALESKDHAAAQKYYQAALHLETKLQQPARVAAAQYGLSQVALALGRHEEARTACLEALEQWVELSDTASAAEALETLAALEEPVDPEGAVRLLGAASAHRCAGGEGDGVGHEPLASRLRAALDDAAFGRAWAAGQAMRLDEALDVARAGSDVYR